MLILCYHGVSKSDEHVWNPRLYIEPRVFRRRLETIRDFGYQVLPLGLAVVKMRERALTAPTAVITFDDGWHDFHRMAWPILREFNYPATVYQTTYYAEHNCPVFDPACSYLLWKGLGRVIHYRGVNGSRVQLDLTLPTLVEQSRRDLLNQVKEQRRSAQEKDKLLQRLAEAVGVSYAEMVESRTLHLMNEAEIREIARAGIDVQLHTHRHRLPYDEQLFLQELDQNRERIERLTATRANHFCYPNGEYRPDLVAWLREAGINSATTCVPGRASYRSDRLLLPRVTDSTTVSQARFESWLAGVGLIAPRFKRAFRQIFGATVAHEAPAKDTGEDAPLAMSATSASTKAAKI